MCTFRLLVGTLVTVLGSAGCLSNSVTGSGQALTESREVGAFVGVAISSSLDATITLAPDDPPALKVSGDDNLVRLVRSRVESDKLVVDLPPNTSVHPKLPLRVTISATMLMLLDVTDSARVTADALAGDMLTVSAIDSAQVDVSALAATTHLSVHASDSGTVRIASSTVGESAFISASDSSDVVMNDVTVTREMGIRVSDSSAVALHGQAASFSAELSDSSHCDAKEFSADDVVLKGADGSTADVCANNSLSLTLSDSSHATYRCDPDDVKQDVRDSSSAAQH
jgi:hypothetical protein